MMAEIEDRGMANLGVMVCGRALTLCVIGAVSHNQEAKLNCFDDQTSGEFQTFWVLYICPDCNVMFQVYEVHSVVFP